MREYSTEELSASDDAFLQGMLAERRRVLALLKAHESFLGMASARLPNLVNRGIDLEEQMKLPIEERIGFMHWPDGDASI